MKLPRIVKTLLLFLLLVIPIMFLIPYFGLNRNTGEVIIDDYKLVPAYNLTFQSPVDIQVIPGTMDLAVVEQIGRIMRIVHTQSENTSSQFFDLTSKVAYGGEMGLLSLAFHPEFTTNGYFFVDYTANNPRRTVIARYTYNQLENTASLESEKIIIEIEQPAANHNGGQIFFGIDGMFYISLGDGGGAGDIYGNAQDTTTLLGSVLRINVSVNDPLTYSIPEDNPFFNSDQGYKEEIYAFGLRNPWRISQDPITSRIWLGDVGQNLYEEINLIESGKNYGWNEMEGFHCYQLDCDKSKYAPPVAEYNHNDGFAVTGGYVYRGNQFSELYGRYFFADYGFGNVWTLDAGFTDDADMQFLVKQNLLISSFGINADGELLVCDLNGKIYEFERVYD